jgi:hypothetical protein
MGDFRSPKWRRLHGLVQAESSDKLTALPLTASFIYDFVIIYLRLKLHIS